MNILNRVQLHQRIGAFIDSALDSSKPISTLIVVGREGVGKTSIMLEEAKVRGQFPKTDVDLEIKAGPGNYYLVEFPAFIFVKAEFYESESEKFRDILQQVLINWAAPISSSRSQMKSILLEIDCQNNEVPAIEDIFKPLPIIHYVLSKEEFKEWACEKNKDTGLPNIDPMILPIALQNYEDEYESFEFETDDDWDFEAEQDKQPSDNS